MLALLLAAIAVASFAIPASAQDSGLAAMHTMRREGGKLCMSDHWHYGSSGSQRDEGRCAARRHRFLAGLHRSRVRPRLGALQPRGFKEDRLLARSAGLELRRRSAALQVV